MMHLMTGAVVEAGVLARMNLETTGTPRVSTLSVCLSVCPSVCLSVCLPVCLFNFFFICLYIHLFPSFTECVCVDTCWWQHT